MRAGCFLTMLKVIVARATETMIVHARSLVMNQTIRPEIIETAPESHSDMSRSMET